MTKSFRTKTRKLSTGHTLAGINKLSVGKTFFKRNKILNGLLVVQYVNFKIFYAIFVIFN